MTMWKVTIAPSENLAGAWHTFHMQNLVCIGWPRRQWDHNDNVIRFQQINVGDWVVAHVPKIAGGDNCLARGLGQITGPYHEITQIQIPQGDGWIGAFRRQFPVKWTLADHSLRGILNPNQFRKTVVQLSSVQEIEILRHYGII